jgi:hypothetical protein
MTGYNVLDNQKFHTICWGAKSYDEVLFSWKNLIWKIVVVDVRGKTKEGLVQIKIGIKLYEE